MELNKAINDDIDLEWIIEEEKPSTKKHVGIYGEDNATMVFYKTSNYVAGAKSSELVEIMKVNQLTVKSSQSSQQLLVPK